MHLSYNIDNRRCYVYGLHAPHTWYASGLDQHEPDRHGWAGSLLIYCSTFTEYKNSKLLGSTQRAAIAHYDISICSEFVEHNNCQTLQTTIKTAHPTARAVEASHAACIMNFDIFFFKSHSRGVFLTFINSHNTRYKTSRTTIIHTA